MPFLRSSQILEDQVWEIPHINFLPVFADYGRCFEVSLLSERLHCACTVRVDAERRRRKNKTLSCLSELQLEFYESPWSIHEHCAPAQSPFQKHTSAVDRLWTYFAFEKLKMVAPNMGSKRRKSCTQIFEYLWPPLLRWEHLISERLECACTVVMDASSRLIELQSEFAESPPIFISGILLSFVQRSWHNKAL